jgi:hypothetical protein
MRMNDNYQNMAIKIRLFKHLTNIISPTDAKQSNGMENQALVRSINYRSIAFLVDHSNEYEM